MRTIKFRAWDGEKMYDWDYLKRFTSNWLDNDDRESSFKPMQFTGLKDNNGVEIYEGDVLSVIHSGKGIEWFVRVFWDSTELRGGWQVIHEEKGNARIYPIDEFLMVEVVGNIYQNPELLK